MVRLYVSRMEWLPNSYPRSCSGKMILIKNLFKFEQPCLPKNIRVRNSLPKEFSTRNYSVLSKARAKRSITNIISNVNNARVKNLKHISPKF